MFGLRRIIFRLRGDLVDVSGADMTGARLSRAVSWFFKLSRVQREAIDWQAAGPEPGEGKTNSRFQVLRFEMGKDEMGDGQYEWISKRRLFDGGGSFINLLTWEVGAECELGGMVLLDPARTIHNL